MRYQTDEGLREDNDAEEAMGIGIAILANFVMRNHLKIMHNNNAWLHAHCPETCTSKATLFIHCYVYFSTHTHDMLPFIPPVITIVTASTSCHLYAWICRDLWMFIVVWHRLGQELFGQKTHLILQMAMHLNEIANVSIYVTYKNYTYTHTREHENVMHAHIHATNKKSASNQSDIIDKETNFTYRTSYASNVYICNTHATWWHARCTQMHAPLRNTCLLWQVLGLSLLILCICMYVTVIIIIMIRNDRNSYTHILE